MAESATGQIRKVGTTYLDWHDRETTEQAYLSQFPSFSKDEEEPQLRSGKITGIVTSVDDMPIMAIVRSEIPNAQSLVRAGFIYVNDVPTTKKQLVAIKGIGPKGAESILEYLQQE